MQRTTAEAEPPPVEPPAAVEAAEPEREREPLLAREPVQGRLRGPSAAEAVPVGPLPADPVRAGERTTAAAEHPARLPVEPEHPALAVRPVRTVPPAVEPLRAAERVVASPAEAAGPSAFRVEAVRVDSWSSFPLHGTRFWSVLVSFVPSRRDGFLDYQGRIEGKFQPFQRPQCLLVLVNRIHQLSVLRIPADLGVHVPHPYLPTGLPDLLASRFVEHVATVRDLNLQLPNRVAKAFLPVPNDRQTPPRLCDEPTTIGFFEQEVNNVSHILSQKPVFDPSQASRVLPDRVQR